MKRNWKRLGLGALAWLGMVAVGTASAAPQSYPLVCRGGGGTLGLNSSISSALFYFQKAPGPAGAGLAPGQCSWVDRAIGANEPTCVQQRGVLGSAWLFPDRLQQSYMTSTQAPWLRTLLSAGSYQTFQAYNPGNGGCFVVTRLGP